MGISQIVKRPLVLAALLTANAPALADPKFDYLPEAQALAMQRAIETGARLTPYDKQFLFWTALNLVNPDCGIVGAGEAQDLELMLTEAASGSLLTDPFLSVQAQADFFSHALSMEKSPCHNEDGKKLLGEIAMVLTEDSKGSRADLGKMLEEMEILPKTEEPVRGQGLQTAALYKSDIRILGNYNVDLLCVSGANDGTDHVCGEINSLIGSGTVRTLICVYGPFEVDGTGFATYQFWYENPPENIEAYRIAGRAHPFRGLGSAAVTSCPSDSNAAMQFHQQNRL